MVVKLITSKMWMRVLLLSILPAFLVNCLNAGFLSAQSVDTNIPEAIIKTVNGYPRLYINGERIVPVMPFVNTDLPQSIGVSERQLKLAADAGGIHLHHIIISLPLPDASGKFNLDILKTYLDMVRRADPKGYVILRITLGDNYRADLYDENDKVKFANGTVADAISLASDTWEKNAARELQAIIAYVLSNPDYARAVVGYHLTAGETGEWFQYLYREHGVDISGVNTSKFRQWLFSKYKTVDELRRSWNSSAVSFENAIIPSDQLSIFQQHPRTLYDKDTDQPVLDYVDYYNAITADRIIKLARVVKDNTKGKSLVGAFYGYTFELPDAKSGHYGVDKILNCPDIDFLDGPVSYHNRNEGGVGGSMSLVESIKAHGKMWFDECDYRSPITTFDPGPMDDPMPSIKTYEGLIEVFRRQMGFQMLKGNGGWAMDLSGKGWYDNADFWREMGELKDLYSKYEKIRPVLAPQIAFIVDEEGFALGADFRFNAQMLLFLRDELYKTGVTFGIYLRTDLEKGLVPPASLYIIAGNFRLKPENVRKLSAKLHQPGATVVWMYGFGNTDKLSISKLTGMEIYDSGKSLVPEITLSKTSKVLLPEIADVVSVGTGVKDSPIWSVHDPDKDVKVLGTTAGEVTFAQSNINGSNQIFYGSNVLNAHMLRALARYAGAHVFNGSGWDACMANANMVVIHSSAKGRRTIDFPAKTDVYEQFSGKWHLGVNRVALDVPAAKTCIFFYGDKSFLTKAGIGTK